MEGEAGGRRADCASGVGTFVDFIMSFIDGIGAGGRYPLCYSRISVHLR